MTINKVAVLGSGIVGETLANGFLKHGYSAMRASREPKKLEQWKASAKGEAAIGTFADAAKWGDLVVLAVKGNAAEQVVEQIGGHINGKIVVDTCNPIAEEPPNNGVLRYFTNINESLMERLQKKAPQAKFVKAWNSVANVVMVNPKLSQQPTMFICGNDADAKKQVGDILNKFGWESHDTGLVESARAIEALCMLYCIDGIRNNDWAHGFKYIK